MSTYTVQTSQLNFEQNFDEAFDKYKRIILESIDAYLKYLHSLNPLLKEGTLHRIRSEIQQGDRKRFAQRLFEMSSTYPLEKAISYHFETTIKRGGGVPNMNFYDNRADNNSNGLGSLPIEVYFEAVKIREAYHWFLNYPEIKNPPDAALASLTPPTAPALPIDVEVREELLKFTNTAKVSFFRDGGVEPEWSKVRREVSKSLWLKLQKEANTAKALSDVTHDEFALIEAHYDELIAFDEKPENKILVNRHWLFIEAFRPAVPPEPAVAKAKKLTANQIVASHKPEIADAEKTKFDGDKTKWFSDFAKRHGYTQAGNTLEKVWNKMPKKSSANRVGK